MKRLNLNALDVEEMTNQEISETNGGSILLVLAIAAVAALACSCTVKGDVIINVGNGNSTSTSGDSLHVENTAEVSVVPAP